MRIGFWDNNRATITVTDVYQMTCDMKSKTILFAYDDSEFDGACYMGFRATDSSKVLEVQADALYKGYAMFNQNDWEYLGTTGEFLPSETCAAWSAEDDDDTDEDAEPQPSEEKTMRISSSPYASQVNTYATTDPADLSRHKNHIKDFFTHLFY